MLIQRCLVYKAHIFFLKSSTFMILRSYKVLLLLSFSYNSLALLVKTPNVRSILMYNLAPCFNSEYFSAWRS